MNQIVIGDVIDYVEQNIGVFHERRIEGLKELKLKVVLKKKNPYLFKARYILTAGQIVKQLTDAFLSSKEETLFGNWLEGLAIFINQKVYSGWKSGISGIDLEFNENNIRYIVAIKSGPNWGNSSQIGKMKTDFISAKRTLRTSNVNTFQVIAVNGCCYGQCRHTDKGEYFKYCGQNFWKFISGSDTLYKDIIEPMGHKAKEKNDQFIQSYSNMINIFTSEFVKDFCRSDGSIDWEELIEFNSKIQ